MIIILQCILIICVIWISNSFHMSSMNKHRNVRYNRNILNGLKDVKEVDFDDPGLKEFLKGPENKKWNGVRDMMPRKGQVPDERYTPRDVVTICLSALQNNDDPQLDHGACVVLEFKSLNGPLNDPSLDPAKYGAFLRSTEYASLLDFKTAEFLGEPTETVDSLSVKQSVNIVGWNSKSEKNKIFDFYLSRVDNKWLIDVILIKK